MNVARRGRRGGRWAGLPLALVLLVISLKLLGMSWWSRDGAAAYDDGRYRASESSFSRLQMVNVIEPWKAWFALGDARYRLNDLTGAETAFRAAVQSAPERCDARFNLVVTIEAQGDRLVGDDILEVTESERQDGLARYRVALDILNDEDCPVVEPDGPGARLAATRDRLEVKLGAENRPQDDSRLDAPGDDEAERGEADDTQSQQDQLEARNQQGAADRQDSSDIEVGGDRPPREPNW